MYIQLTTRCNMTCEHCCFGCTAKGDDMDEDTFQQCLDLSSGYVCLGGGEPTVHPKFEQFLLNAISDPNMESVEVITNGKKTKTALRLAGLMKVCENFGCRLSLDEYHERIEYQVMDAFRGHIHNTSEYKEPTKHGRAMTEVFCMDQEEIDEEIENRDGSECMCYDTFVKPNGDVHQCGCDDAPKIGDIFNGYDTPCAGECCHSSEFVDACMEAYEELLV